MIDKTTHGIIDYLTGALLVIAPYLFGFSTGGIEQWLAQVIGAAVIVMSLVTDYRPSIVRLIPFKVHLGIDLLAGVVLAVFALDIRLCRRDLVAASDGRGDLDPGGLANHALARDPVRGLTRK